MLEKLFAPGAALLQRMSFPQKLALVGLLLVPFAVTSSLLIADVHQAVSAAELKRAGLARILPLVALMRDVQQHRGMAAGLLAGQPRFDAPMQALAARIDAALAALARPPAGDAAGRDAALPWTHWRREWAALAASLPGFNERTSFAAHTAFIGHILDAIVRTGESSGLLLAAEHGGYYLMNALVHRLPLLTEQMGQARAFGVELLAGHGSDPVRLAGAAASIKHGLDATHRELRLAFQRNPTLEAELAVPLEHAVTAAVDYASLIDAVVNGEAGSAGRSAVDARAYFDAATAAVDAAYALLRPTAAALDARLAEQIRSHSRRLAVTLTAIGATLLLSVYLLASFYYGVIRSITELAGYSRRVLAGDLDDEPNATLARDELGAVSAALRDLAVQIRGYIADLHAEREHLATTLHSIGDAVVVTDTEGRIVRMNPPAERLTGWAAGEATGRPAQEVLRLVNRRTGQDVPSPIRAALASGTVVELDRDAELLARDGTRRDVADSAAPIRDAAGKTAGAVMVLRDVSRELRLERELRRSNERWQFALEVRGDGVWDWNLASGEVYYSPRWRELLGFREERPGSDIGERERRLHPEDRDRVCEALARHLRGEIPELDSEHRMLRRDGGEIWVRERVKVVERDAAGRPLRVLGTVAEISARKQTELELRLAAKTFEISEAIMVTDAHGNIQRVNRSFTEITGYLPHEVIGRNPRMFQSGRHDEAFYRRLWSTLTERGHWRGEIWNKRKNGEIYPQWLTITAVKDDTGRTTHFVAAFSDITERKENELRIQQLAFYDPLTGLANRTLLQERLAQGLAAANRHGLRGALLFLDLDNFKTINDALGHATGDALLKQVAARLNEQLRTEDTVARLGGDEFVVLLGNLGDNDEVAADQAYRVAQKIRAALAEPYQLDGHELTVTPSIGISLFPKRGQDASSVLKQADTAMYQAKADGRNAARFYEPRMQEGADRRLALQKDLRQALVRGDLRLHYQPQIGARGEVIGAEALVRWRHPQRGMVPPIEFISVAEETGLILAVGEWVLETACRQLAAWMRAGVCIEHLAVNVSSRQLRQPDFVACVRSVLERTGAEAAHLVLELTEGMLLDDVDDAIEKMQKLRTIGVRFSLDDFGVGYSSLSYLKRLPLDHLKIDKSFVADVPGDPNDAVIVKTIIAMARNLGLGVIAEGVETEAQLRFLESEGCYAYQGYYFGRPLPIAAFERYLQEGGARAAM